MCVYIYIYIFIYTYIYNYIQIFISTYRFVQMRSVSTFVVLRSAGAQSGCTFGGPWHRPTNYQIFR